MTNELTQRIRLHARISAQIDRGIRRQNYSAQAGREWAFRLSDEIELPFDDLSRAFDESSEQFRCFTDAYYEYFSE